MSARGLPKSFHRIRELALKPADTIPLGVLMRRTNSDQRSLIRQGRWLQQQLPIRFARRLDDFFQLPYVVVNNPKFNQVLDMYLETFEAVTDVPDIITARDEAAFSGLIEDQFIKHSSVAQLVSEGYGEIRHMYPHIRLDDFLNNLFITRVSSRILADNYVVSRNPREGYVGVVKRDLMPLTVVENLAATLTNLTQSLYGYCPEVECRGNLDCSLDYVPRHVVFMVRELLKNAIRATAERHRTNLRKDSSAKLPPVVVELHKGDIHVIIKISDQGGGMPKHVQKDAWQYGWTTVQEVSDTAPEVPDTPGFDSAAPNSKELAGFGFGLPLTRLYAQYFGGDVFMQALPGHGTDMYLLLNHLKEGCSSTETDDPSTTLTRGENLSTSIGSAP